MPKLKPRVMKVLPERIDDATPYAVLYIEASDNFDAIDCANDWAREHGMERARELTLGRARLEDQRLYVGRCYRLAPFKL